MYRKIYILQYILFIMAEGYGVKIGDWALIGIVAVAGFIAYKTFAKPAAQVTGAVGDIAEGTAGAFNNTLDFLNHRIDNLDNAYGFLSSNISNSWNAFNEALKNLGAGRNQTTNNTYVSSGYRAGLRDSSNYPTGQIVTTPMTTLSQYTQMYVNNPTAPLRREPIITNALSQQINALVDLRPRGR